MTDINLKKLLWRCRRGTKELDLILGGFVGHHFCELHDEDKIIFDQLLQVQDPILADWIDQRTEADDKYRLIIERIIKWKNNQGLL